MKIQYTSNNVPYETNWIIKLACLLPIEGVHTKEQAMAAIGELATKYFTYHTRIDWQKP